MAEFKYVYLLKPDQNSMYRGDDERALRVDSVIESHQAERIAIP